MAEANEEVDVESLTQTVEGEAQAAPVDSNEDIEPEEPGVDWSGLSQELEEDTYDEAPEPQETVSEAKEDEESQPAPEPVPQEPEPPVQEEVQEPVVAETQQPEPEVPQEPETPEQPQLSQEQIAELRTQYVNELSARYQISEEDATAFATGDVNTVLPQLAANLHANVIQEVTAQVANMLQQYVPTAIEQFTTQRESRQAGETEFYGQWPELKADKARVTQIVAAYRQLNPSAPKEQVFRDAGIQAWMALGLDPAQLAAKLTPEPAATPEPVRRPPPPAPANPGGSHVPPAPRNLNPFEALSFEFEDLE